MIDSIRALTQPNPSFVLELFSIAHENDLAVIDDIYVDWMKLARALMSLQFHPALGAFPGLRIHLRADAPDLQGLIAEMVASSHLLEASEDMMFSLLGPMNSFAESQHVPHRDADVQISGLIYLCESDSDAEGTGFYRHRPSGLCGALLVDPALIEAAQSSPFDTLDEFLLDLSSFGPGRSIYGSAPSDTWELVHAVELRPNRLVLFDSTLFHAALSPRDQATRLTQNLFLRAQPGTERVKFRRRP